VSKIGLLEFEVLGTFSGELIL